MAGFQQSVQDIGAPQTGSVGLLGKAAQERAQAIASAGSTTASATGKLISDVGNLAIAGAVEVGKAKEKSYLETFGADVADLASTSVVTGSAGTHVGSRVGAMMEPTGEGLKGTVFDAAQPIDPAISAFQTASNKVRAAADQGIYSSTDAYASSEAKLRAAIAQRPDLSKELKEVHAQTWQDEIYGKMGKVTHDLLVARQVEDNAKKAADKHYTEVAEWHSQYSDLPMETLRNPAVFANAEMGYRADKGRERNGKMIDQELKKVTNQQQLDSILVGPVLKNNVQEGRGAFGAEFTNVVERVTLSADDATKLGQDVELVAGKAGAQMQAELLRIASKRGQTVNGIPYDEQLLTKMEDETRTYWKNTIDMLRDKEKFNAYKSAHEILKTKVDTQTLMVSYIGPYNNILKTDPRLAQAFLQLSADFVQVGKGDWATRDYFTDADRKIMEPFLQKQNLTWNSFLEVQNAARIQDGRSINQGKTRVINESQGNSQVLANKALTGDPHAQLVAGDARTILQTTRVEELKGNPTKQVEFANSMDIWTDMVMQGKGYKAMADSIAMLTSKQPQIDQLPKDMQDRVNTKLLGAIQRTIVAPAGPIDSLIGIKRKLADTGLPSDTFSIEFNKATNKLVLKNNYKEPALFSGPETMGGGGLYGDAYAFGVPYAKELLTPGFPLLRDLGEKSAAAFKNREVGLAARDAQANIDRLNTSIGQMANFSKFLDKPMSQEGMYNAYASHINNAPTSAREAKGVIGDGGLPATSPVQAREQQVTQPIVAPAKGISEKSKLTAVMQSNKADLEQELSSVNARLADTRVGSPTHNVLVSDKKEIEEQLRKIK